MYTFKDFLIEHGALENYKNEFIKDKTRKAYTDTFEYLQERLNETSFGSIISTSFTWKNTKQGHDYWHDLSSKERNVRDAIREGKEFKSKKEIDKGDIIDFLIRLRRDGIDIDMMLCIAFANGVKPGAEGCDNVDYLYGLVLQYLDSRAIHVRDEN